MQSYRVVDHLADPGKLVVRCGQGRYHVARALNAIPPAHVPLVGAQIHLGFGILLCQASGAIFRVIFESINHPNPAFDAQGTPTGPLSRPLASPATYGAHRGG